MAILGYSTKGGTATGFDAGRKYVTKFNLASPATLTELHGWFGGGSGSDHIKILIYAADGNGSGGSGTDAGTLLAVTSALALTGSDVHLSETGFSVSLPAGDYWIGWIAEHAAGQTYRDSGATYNGITSGANFTTVTNPWSEGFDGGGDRKYSVWAVVSFINAVTLSASVGTSASVSRTSSKSLTAIPIVNALINRNIVITKSGIAVVTSSIQTNRVLPGTLSTAVTVLADLVKQPQRVLTATTTAVASRVAALQKVKTAVATTTATVLRPATNRVISATASALASIFRATPPTPQEIDASGKVIMITFTNDLSSINPGTSEFALTIGGVSTPVASTLVTGRFLYLMTSATIAGGALVDVVYTPGTLSANGSAIASFHLTTTSDTVDDSVPQLTTIGGFNDLTT